MRVKKLPPVPDGCERVFVDEADDRRCCHCGCRSRDMVEGRYLYREGDRYFCSDICRRIENNDPNVFEVSLA